MQTLAVGAGQRGRPARIGQPRLRGDGLDVRLRRDDRRARLQALEVGHGPRQLLRVLPTGGIVAGWGTGQALRCKEGERLGQRRRGGAGSGAAAVTSVMKSPKPGTRKNLRVV